MQGLKLIHVRKRGPKSANESIIEIWYAFTFEATQ